MSSDLTNGDQFPSSIAAPQGFQSFQQIGLEQPDDEDSAPKIGRYLAALKRYRWMIVGITLVGSVLGTLSTRFLKPVFTAQATLWVQDQGRLGVGDAQPIAQGNLLDSQAWVELLKTYQVLDEVVRRERLYLIFDEDDAPLFDGFALADSLLPGSFALRVSESGRTYTLTSSSGARESGAVGDSIGRSLGFRWQPDIELTPPEFGVDFVIEIPRDAAVELGSKLDPRIDLNGNFLRVVLTGPSPGRVARVLNAVIERYVEVAADLKRGKLVQRVNILEEQLARSRAHLDTTEVELERFRIETITLPTDAATPIVGGIAETRGPVFDDYFRKQIDRDFYQRDRNDIIAELDRAADTGVLAVGALEIIASVQASSEMSQALTDLAEKTAELRTLRSQFTDEHPPIRTLLRDIATLQTSRIPRIGRDLANQLQNRLDVLDQQITVAGVALQAIPPRMIEEARLQRDLTIANELYGTLQERYQQSRLAEMSVQPDIDILDRAVAPQRPSKNSAPQIMLMGIVASLGLGIAVAILLDRLDKRIRYPDQVTRELGLPILAAIPSAMGPGKNGSRQVDAYHVVEALRGARMNMTYAHGGRWPLIFTITSPGPGDGKSFLSANIALSFAEAGSKTLLIDGDLRRGGLHKSLKLARRPGLSDYLSGNANVEDVLQTSEFGQLDFIGRGRSSPAAPELVGSPVLTALIADLRDKYKVIIVDSPPLGAGVDAFSLGTQTGAMCIVVRRGQTNKDLAGAKLEMLNRLPIHVLGAILNDVSPDDASYHAYSYYMDGYGTEELEDGEDDSPNLLGKSSA